MAYLRNPWGTCTGPGIPRIKHCPTMVGTITGCSAEEAIGRGLISTFIPMSFKGKVWDMVDAAMKGKEVANFECPLKSRTGQLVQVLLREIIWLHRLSIFQQLLLYTSVSCMT